MRASYGPFSSPLLSSPTPSEKVAAPSSNITMGCAADESLIACLERVGRKDIPQESGPADVVPSQRSGSVESDLMLLLPLLLLNAALSYAGSRPKPRLPKRPPCPPQAGKKTLARQFAYQSKAETGKAMRRSNNVKHAAPARRAMASANRGARKGGF
mmetsp:Transcript_31025/g.79227  ORF Transcript_31025/g.79227 Transcript_31025/m.79227 type:complete len:157 (-) Transcript_31025:323-793(-)